MHLVVAYELLTEGVSGWAVQWHWQLPMEVVYGVPMGEGAYGTAAGTAAAEGAAMLHRSDGGSLCRHRQQQQQRHSLAAVIM